MFAAAIRLCVWELLGYKCLTATFYFRPIFLLLYIKSELNNGIVGPRAMKRGPIRVESEGLVRWKTNDNELGGRIRTAHVLPEWTVEMRLCF